ncbi:hypothetical protein R1sor_011832 [Riccia sorocarpa]|uniref:Uncharacterized protein n=1 Tax=Riccia sorocarpa TaxID=122646 RepID=A0ABD3I3B7_9MARC
MCIAKRTFGILSKTGLLLFTVDEASSRDKVIRQRGHWSMDCPNANGGRHPPTTARNNDEDDEVEVEVLPEVGQEKPNEDFDLLQEPSDDKVELLAAPTNAKGHHTDVGTVTTTHPAPSIDINREPLSSQKAWR